MSKTEDYWDKKEKYQRLTRYSGTCWHALYTEEKKKRKLAEKDRDKWEALSQYYGRLLELD